MIKVVSIISLLCLSACAVQPPATQITQAPENDIALSEIRDQQQAFLQSPVRWGGRILSVTEVGQDETQNLHVEVLEYPLDEDGRPVETAGSSGRFIAILSQPFKRSAYRRSRLLTVSGNLQPPEIRNLTNGSTQEIPVVQAAQQYTWRSNDYYDRYDHHPHFWWPRFYFRLGVGRHKHRYGGGVLFVK